MGPTVISEVSPTLSSSIKITVRVLPSAPSPPPSPSPPPPATPPSSHPFSTPAPTPPHHASARLGVDRRAYSGARDTRGPHPAAPTPGEPPPSPLLYLPPEFTRPVPFFAPLTSSDANSSNPVQPARFAGTRFTCWKTAQSTTYIPTAKAAEPSPRMLSSLTGAATPGSPPPYRPRMPLPPLKQ